MKGPRFNGILILALACVLSPPADAETFDLGGPCDSGEGSTVPGYHTKLREAAKRGDHAQTIDLHKLYVRAMCSNHYRWFDLAATYLGADRPGMAIQVLHELHRRGAEIKPATFQNQKSLVALIATPEFQQSELGAELRELRTKSAQRKEGYRETHESLDPTARPPERWVAEGACPFECCSYREWDVLETTPLYDAPFGNEIVGSAAKGDRVRGVTGDVHLRPAPVAVIHDRPPFARGEIIFLLDYLGEGHYNYWRNGEIASGELWIDELCLRPSRDCWAEYIQTAGERPEPRWWVLIETGDGVRGWTDKPDRFGNIDACG